MCINVEYMIKHISIVWFSAILALSIIEFSHHISICFLLINSHYSTSTLMLLNLVIVITFLNKKKKKKKKKSLLHTIFCFSCIFNQTSFNWFFVCTYLFVKNVTFDFYLFIIFVNNVTGFYLFINF